MVTAPASGAAQSQWDVLFHASALSYGDSEVKDGGSVVGFYGTYGTGWKHLVEVGATLAGIDYLDGSRLDQTDASIAYSRFGAHGAGRIGVHAVSSSDPLTDGGLVLFGGGSRYRVGSWSVGAEGAWSSFPDYQEGLTVAQVAPSVGFTAHTEGGKVLGSVFRAYFIRLSEETGLGATAFVSGEASLSLTTGPVTLSGMAWGGEQAFATRSGGFVVFNLSELHTGGFGAGLRWVTTPRSALAAGIHLERFQDIDGALRAWARSVSVSFGLTL
jgi:hypothetical protein